MIGGAPAMAIWKKPLDLSMLRHAGDEQVDALAPDPQLLEELRDARWDGLPTVAAKVENLNRRVRRLETKPDGIEERAKRWAKWIAALAVIAGAVSGPIEKFIGYWKLHGEDASRPPSAERLTVDRVQHPDGGAPK